jgi:hypothetical protein
VGSSNLQNVMCVLVEICPGVGETWSLRSPRSLQTFSGLRGTIYQKDIPLLSILNLREYMEVCDQGNATPALPQYNFIRSHGDPMTSLNVLNNKNLCSPAWSRM